MSGGPVIFVKGDLETQRARGPASIARPCMVQGLIGVDRATQRRSIKGSALAYGSIARRNGAEEEPAPAENTDPITKFSGAALGI